MQNLITILNAVFKNKHTGTYLDIGAYDGVTDNVTNYFYEHGWRGVCVEPQTKYFKLGVEARPGDEWVKGVVVGKQHETSRVNFYETEDGRRSSTIDVLHDTKKKQLKAIKINNDVPRDSFPDGLDLLVIDTGEDDFEIMQSIDLGLFKPNIVAVPSGYTTDRGIILHMQSMGWYQLAPDRTGDWLVFSNNIEDRANA